jgi:dTDP-4-dehydrorhamnose 3,5-epimerase-like enzyme
LRTIDLFADEPATLIIPPGFGHAVQGLSAESLVVYGTNVEYANNKEFEINPISSNLFLKLIENNNNQTLIKQKLMMHHHKTQKKMSHLDLSNQGISVLSQYISLTIM